MSKLNVMSLICLVLTFGCKEEEILNCDGGVNFVKNGSQMCAGFTYRYFLDLEENSESIYIDLSDGAFTKLTVGITSLFSGLLEEGKKYDSKNGEGPFLSGPDLGVINSASVTIVKLDRENKLLTLQFNLDAKDLGENPFVISATFKDLEMIP